MVLKGGESGPVIKTGDGLLISGVVASVGVDDPEELALLPKWKFKKMIKINKSKDISLRYVTCIGIDVVEKIFGWCRTNC